MMKNVKRSFAIALVAVSLIVGIGSAVNAGNWEYCSSCGKYIGNNPHFCRDMMD